MNTDTKQKAVTDSGPAPSVYIRQDATHWYDITQDGSTAFLIEGRAGIYACKGFKSVLEATRAAAAAGINNYELVGASIDTNPFSPDQPETFSRCVKVEVAQ